MTLARHASQAGKLEATIKSEDPPEKNDGPVKVVTAKTFDEIVRSGNDVLLEFYAPWCGHCKSLAPIYEKVCTAARILIAALRTLTCTQLCSLFLTLIWNREAYVGELKTV